MISIKQPLVSAERYFLTKRRETIGRGCALLRVAETAYRCRKTGDKERERQTIETMRRVGELVCGGCHGTIPRLRRLPAPFAQPWTARARPLIFHPVTPINLTAVSESPLWRYPVALSLFFISRYVIVCHLGSRSLSFPVSWFQRATTKYSTICRRLSKNFDICTIWLYILFNKKIFI